MSAPLYCPLPITDKRRAYVSSDHTDVAETWRQHEPIRVSDIRDVYENVQALDWLEPGGFR